MNEAVLEPLAMVGAALALAIVGWLLEVRRNVRLQRRFDALRRAHDALVQNDHAHVVS